MRSILFSAPLLLLASPALAQSLPVWRDASATLPPKEAPGHSMNVRAADVDKDGDLDLVFAMEYRINRLLLNDGRGGFTDVSNQLPQNALDSEEVALADYDSDGDIDIAVANEDDLLPELYLNDGKGRFSDASARIAHRVKANAVVAFDANGDKRPDLFFGGDKVSSLWINTGKARFRDESIQRLPKRFGANQDVAVGDIDGDGDLDLVLGNEDRNQIYVNDGKGVFALADAKALPGAGRPEETRDAELFDADSDGDLDIFFANVALWNPRAVPQNRLLLNDGKGNFTDVTAQWLPQREESTVAAHPIDLDGDGRLDLITTARDNSTAQAPLQNPTALVRAFRNDGTRFVEITDQLFPTPLTANGFDILTEDLDGDGKFDLYIASRGGPDRLLLSRR
jgi:hypothetical protein